MTPAPRISIIIPTHNRKTLLLENLQALAQQTFPSSDMEVVVVADGCSDGTAQALLTASFPFALRVAEQACQGPSAARNHGARLARGEILLFLDDDIEASPRLVQAHAEAHASQPLRVAIGYLPPILQAQTGFFREELRGWWEAMFSPMLVPGYRYRYSNLLTGNFSVAASLFHEAGGFDLQFRCHEDYELGWRLIKLGAIFQFVPQALGYHHENTLIERTFQRKQEEGQADILLSRKHPELLPTLQVARLVNYGSFFTRKFYRLAFDRPAMGERVSRFLARLMKLMEKWGLYYRWQKLLEILLVYNYLRGVAKVFPTRAEWHDFVRQTHAHPIWGKPEMTIDLAEGLDTAQALLDQYRPDAVKFVYEQQVLRREPAYPGVESFRGDHLRVYLAYVLRDAYLRWAVRPNWDETDPQEALFVQLLDRHLAQLNYEQILTETD